MYHSSTWWLAYGIILFVINFGLASAFHFGMDMPWHKIPNWYIGVGLLVFGCVMAMIRR